MFLLSYWKPRGKVAQNPYLLISRWINVLHLRISTLRHCRPAGLRWCMPLPMDTTVAWACSWERVPTGTWRAMYERCASNVMGGSFGSILMFQMAFHGFFAILRSSSTIPFCSRFLFSLFLPKREMKFYVLCFWLPYLLILGGNSFLKDV